MSDDTSLISYLDEETEKAYGYKASDLLPQSAKLIIYKCHRCNEILVRKRKNVNKHGLCRKCAYIYVPRDHYAKGVATRKKTCLEKYGAEHKPFEESAKIARRQTNMERYGGPAPMCNPTIQEKTRITSMARYGTPYAVTAPATREKAEQTMLEHHGVKYSRQSPALQAKAIETIKRNYGVTNPGQHPTLHAKAIITTLERYGTLTPKNYGKAEQAIHDWLLSLGVGAIKRNVVLPSGKSLDIFVEASSIAIEYCGLFWHHEQSPTPRGPSYHHDKMQEAIAQNIRLITLFEDEWLYRRASVENTLKTILNKSTQRLGARKCALQELPPATANTFLDAHHLQGAGRGVLFATGLSTDDELLGVLTLSTHHRQGQNAVVLNRLCFKTDTSIAGGASRLLAPALTWARNNGYHQMISWSDNRWFTGTVYQKMGFTLAEELRPDYSYVVQNNPKTRISKQTQQKKKTNCPPGLTELEWAHQRGLARIWDCGHKRWELQL